jgi:Spy/CpxP family protein refolding chaperone
MKKSIWFALSVAAAVSVGGLLTLRAAENAANPVSWGPRTWANAKAKLGLTDDQIVRIKTELRPDKAALIELSLKVHQARIGLRDAIKKPGETEAEIRAAASSLGDAEGNLAVIRARLHARVSPILTAQQLDQIHAWEQKGDNFADAAIVAYINRMVD